VERGRAAPWSAAPSGDGRPPYGSLIDVFGLRKAVVDLEHHVINATISKGKKARRLPVHDALVADLERQLATPGPYLFAWDRTKRLPNLVKMLRRACGRAGLVTGHELRCRRRAACGWTEERGGVQPPPVPDACPRCGHDSLYTRPIPRKVRFHDLRHSFGTAVVAAAARAPARRCSPTPTRG
jgi:integrase